jgi:hypothetical protein
MEFFEGLPDIIAHQEFDYVVALFTPGVLASTRYLAVVSGGTAT